MKTQLVKYGLVGLCLLGLGGMLWAANLTLSQAGSEQSALVSGDDAVPVTQGPIPTPVGAQTFSPLPTPQGNASVDGFGVNQDVYMGPVTMLASALTPENAAASRYTIREVPGEKYTRPKEYVRPQQLFMMDTVAGQEVQFGDDRGHASFEILTDQYLIWRYQWQGISETLAYETGLYAYVLETGDEIVIAQQPEIYPWHPKIDGQWVLYMDAQDAQRYSVKLRVHNLETGEDFRVGKRTPHSVSYGRSPGSQYAIGDGKIAWMETDEDWGIWVYDLTTRTAREVTNTLVNLADHLAISGNVVVWWYEGWMGYDLLQDAAFTFSLTPPGWKNIRLSYADYTDSPLSMKDEQLYWGVEVNGQAYYFTAPIVRNQ